MAETVLITGASSGIGYEFAKRFAQEGYNLILVALHKDKLHAKAVELRKNYDTTVAIIPLDLAEPHAGYRLFRKTEELGIRIDILINDAGFADFGELSQKKLDKQLSMINLNVATLTELTYLYMKPMIKRGNGKILNVASMAAFQAGPYLSVYSATKAYVSSFTQALAEENRDTGVTFTALFPGATDTDFTRRAEIEPTGVFSNLPQMSCEKVAELGYRALMRDKVVEIPGISNKLLLFLTRFAPFSLVRKLTAKIQS